MAIDVRISKSLVLVDEFKNRCPPILLGIKEEGGFALDNIIRNLTLLEKIQLNKNDINQSQLLNKIADDIKKLQGHLDGLEKDNDFPYREQANQFRASLHYQHLDIILINIVDLQKSTFAYSTTKTSVFFSNNTNSTNPSPHVEQSPTHKKQTK